jgi:signal transduction histidine kinase
MSHELRTPLNAVIGFSEIMEQKLYGGIDRRYHEYSTLIRESGQHLLSIINDILDIAKLQSGKTELRLELVDVAQVIGEALRLVSEQAQSALIALDWESRGGLRPIEADIVRLRQVLLNLLSNAIKFTPEGGRVVIRARMDGGLVRIDVRDTGIGMAREDIPKALEPFGQIDNALTRQQQGTGLGLPLAKNLVELHGGRFEIASEPGAGTEVSILFPAAPQPRAAPATAFALPGLAGRD